MIISGSQIRELDRHLDSSNYGRVLVFGAQVETLTDPIIDRIGFAPGRSVGDSVLPASDLGTVSMYNAEGKVIIHKDKPKETAYRQAEWTWQEWRGSGYSVFGSGWSGLSPLLCAVGSALSCRRGHQRVPHRPAPCCTVAQHPSQTTPICIAGLLSHIARSIWHGLLADPMWPPIALFSHLAYQDLTLRSTGATPSPVTS